MYYVPKWLVIYSGVASILVLFVILLIREQRKETILKDTVHQAMVRAIPIWSIFLLLLVLYIIQSK